MGNIVIDNVSFHKHVQDSQNNSTLIETLVRLFGLSYFYKPPGLTFAQSFLPQLNFSAIRGIAMIRKVKVLVRFGDEKSEGRMLAYHRTFDFHRVYKPEYTLITFIRPDIKNILIFGGHNRFPILRRSLDPKVFTQSHRLDHPSGTIILETPLNNRLG